MSVLGSTGPDPEKGAPSRKGLVSFIWDVGKLPMDPTVSILSHDHKRDKVGFWAVLVV